jgi:hypothetical protein
MLPIFMNLAPVALTCLDQDANTVASIGKHHSMLLILVYSLPTMCFRCVGFC